MLSKVPYRVHPCTITGELGRSGNRSSRTFTRQKLGLCLPCRGTYPILAEDYRAEGEIHGRKIVHGRQAG